MEEIGCRVYDEFLRKASTRKRIARHDVPEGEKGSREGQNGNGHPERSRLALLCHIGVQYEIKYFTR